MKKLLSYLHRVLDRNMIAAATRQHMLHNYEPFNVLMERGEGVWLFDNDGRKILDMFGAYAVVSWGHANPKILSALISQACRGGAFSRGVLTENPPRFAAMLLRLAGFVDPEDKVHFTVSGRDAVEDAIKFARRWGYREKQIRGIPEIIACENNFHGRGLTSLSCSTEEHYRKDFGPFLDGFKIIPFGDAAALEAAIGPETAAFLVEPIQGEGGVNVPPKGYLREVEQICRWRNILLMVDEIQTGLGRTGKNFCFMHDGVEPDMVVVGKALGGGLVPSYAVVGHGEIMNLIGPGDHGGTFEAYPLQCAVGIAVMELLEEEVFDQRAAEAGDYLIGQIENLASPLVKEIRGKGLLIGIEFANGVSAKHVRKELLERRVLTGIAHNVLRLSPPLTIGRDEIDFAVEKISEVLRELISFY